MPSASPTSSAWPDPEGDRGRHASSHLSTTTPVRTVQWADLLDANAPSPPIG
jgi:hypothetical protein